jgi:hypothetical protein
MKFKWDDIDRGTDKEIFDLYIDGAYSATFVKRLYFGGYGVFVSQVFTDRRLRHEDYVDYDYSEVYVADTLEEAKAWLIDVMTKHYQKRAA